MAPVIIRIILALMVYLFIHIYLRTQVRKDRAELEDDADRHCRRKKEEEEDRIRRVAIRTNRTACFSACVRAVAHTLPWTTNMPSW